VLGALAIVAVAMFAVVTRRPKRRVAEPHTQTMEPQVYEPPSGDAAVPAPLEAPASTAPMPAAVSAAAQDPTSSAAQIAELEAAVAMPSAGSPVSEGDNGTVDVPAPLVDKPEPSEERLERIKALQRQLTWLGFHPGRVDGRYGPQTTEAIRRFQEVRGLPADGVAHPATLTALRAGTPDRPFSGRAQRVQELQRELTGQGYEPGPDDGRYGPRTTDAVKRFQRAKNLPDDGVADQATLQALHGQKPNQQPFMRREERVKELQHQLSALGLEPGLIDGRYGPKTTDAVRRFQRAHDLPVDGIADPVTLNALKASVNGSPFTVRTERVKELQRELHRNGLEPGMVDGRYGPQTTQAVKRFQEAHNLAPDGIADPETLSQIRQTNPTTPERELSQTQD
jgi:peptidoglycan hydrolase-like protein with peptidoglycan-binding domain